MKKNSQPEVWLRGPLPDMPPLLQPVAHALMQAREEVNELMDNFNPDSIDPLDARPAGVASIRFHLQHLTGVLDRLFTYARGEKLSEVQLENLKEEGIAGQNQSLDSLLTRFNQQIETSLNRLKNTDVGTLTEVRYVGRAQVPSTVLGLLVHAAEHTMRHVGQLLVTVKIVASEPGLR